MVWFQCEDCGENLKKPKLPNHFRLCSANKLSCIDCGQIFGQQSVQLHTQCITEAEKYGPKGQGKASNMPAKPNSSSKQKPDVDINVGLSERPPWFCSLCNTSATSRQTLLLHAEGKKHRAKARAFHASKQQAKPTEESTPNDGGSTGNTRKDELPGTESVTEQYSSEVTPAHNSSGLESKKRKLQESKEDTGQKASGDTFGDLGNGEVIQVAKSEMEETKCEVKKAKCNGVKEAKEMDYSSSKNDGKKKIKWKKLISTALKSNSDGALKMRKLRKQVLQNLKESGFTENENELVDKLEHKINSSSKFAVNGKYVQLVTRS